MPALKIKDTNGNWIPLPTIQGADGKDGTDGKSAYQQAVDAGYIGTEAAFYAALVNIAEVRETAKRAEAQAALMYTAANYTGLASVQNDAENVLTVMPSSHASVIGNSLYIYILFNTFGDFVYNADIFSVQLPSGCPLDFDDSVYGFACISSLRDRNFRLKITKTSPGNAKIQSEEKASLGGLYIIQLTLPLIPVSSVAI